MALERCGGGLRCLLLTSNILVLGMGVAMIVVGVRILVDRDSGKFVDGVADSTTSRDGFAPALSSSSSSPPPPVVVVPYSEVSDTGGVLYVLFSCLIAMGSCAVVFALLGFAGTLCQSRILLGICFILQLLVFIASIGVAVYLYIEKDEIDVDKGKLHPLISNAIEAAVRSYHSKQQSKEFMDTIQKKYTCCGSSNGGGDYAPIYPMPCEITHSENPCVPRYEDDVVSHLGLKEFFGEKINIGFAFSACLAAFLIVLQILTLFVWCSLGRSE